MSPGRRCLLLAEYNIRHATLGHLLDLTTASPVSFQHTCVVYRDAFAKFMISRLTKPSPVRSPELPIPRTYGVYLLDGFNECVAFRGAVCSLHAYRLRLFATPIKRLAYVVDTKE